jgi:uncharacterized membrane protein YhaH (DUF805 family)
MCKGQTMIDEDAINSIEKLHRLKSEGVITDTDFEEAKQRILRGGATRKAVNPRDFFTHNDGLPGDDDWQAWIMLPIKRSLVFRGRSARKEFWPLYAVSLALLLGAGIINVVSGMAGIAILGAPFVLLFLLLVIGLSLPLVAVQARRFHDLDRSGWFVLLNLIPYVGPLIVLVFMLFEGTDGKNRFGPNPREG